MENQYPLTKAYSSQKIKYNESNAVLLNSYLTKFQMESSKSETYSLLRDINGVRELL